MQGYKIKERRVRPAGVAACILVFAVAALVGAFGWGYLEHSPDRLPQAGMESQSFPEEMGEMALPQPETSGISFQVGVGPREQFPGAVAGSEAVEDSYFDDAIFFGDSISTGIPLYKSMPGAQVVAYTGVDMGNALTGAVIDVDGERMTLLEAAKQYGNKGKVYILLGGNSLGLSKEDFVGCYREFVLAVREQYPDAVIYLQSMTPVTESETCQELYPHTTNARLDEYNLAIYELSQDLGVSFVDVASALMTSEGKLPEEASPVDGMHFGAVYYLKWADYLKTHTVKGDLAN